MQCFLPKCFARRRSSLPCFLASLRSVSAVTEKIASDDLESQVGALIIFYMTHILCNHLFIISFSPVFFGSGFSSRHVQLKGGYPQQTFVPKCSHYCYGELVVSLSLVFCICLMCILSGQGENQQIHAKVT